MKKSKPYPVVRASDLPEKPADTAAREAAKAAEHVAIPSDSGVPPLPEGAPRHGSQAGTGVDGDRRHNPYYSASSEIDAAEDPEK